MSNQELKLRVWDKLRNKMKYLNTIHDAITFDNKGIARYANLQDGSGGDEYEIMQWTGCKDDNGKYIYKSDILRIYEDSADENPDYIDVVVYFNNIGNCLSIDYDFGDYDTTSLGWAFVNFEEGNNRVEIIGNIHENPELLEENNDN